MKDSHHRVNSLHKLSVCGPRNVFVRLGKCRETHHPDLGIEALGAGLEV